MTVCEVSACFFFCLIFLKRSTQVEEGSQVCVTENKVEVEGREEEQRVTGGSEDEMIKNLIKMGWHERKETD